MHNKYVAVVIVGVLALTLNNFGMAHASFKGPDYSTKPSEPSFGYAIYDDSVPYLANFSSIYGSDIKVGVPTTNVECSSVNDDKCANANSLRVSAILPPCGANADVTDICIKSLKTSDASGQLQDAVLQFEANTNKFQKDSANRLPAGGGVSVWKGTSSTGQSRDYSVIVNLEINVDRDAQGKFTQKFVVGFNAAVIPTKVVTGNYYPYYWKKSKTMNVVTVEPQSPDGTQPPGAWDCTWVDLGRCAVEDTFAAGQKIDLTLQMDSAVSGWLFGRMKSTEVSSTPLSSYTTLLHVAGTSINVPNGMAWVPTKAVDTGSAALQEYARLMKVIKNDINSGTFFFARPSNHPDLFQFPTTGLLGGEIFKPSQEVAGVGELSAISPWLKTSSETPTWRFQGMDSHSFWGVDQSLGNKIYQCTVNDKTKIHGMMTTNAMAYSWSPPALKDGFLTYQVGGAHTDLDGSVYKGSYNLSMNLDSAKCIYGFTDAPIHAAVSIVDASGQAQDVATEIVNVKNNWINLAADNFTFSTPTIRFKLTQDPSIAAAPKPSPATGATLPSKAPVVPPAKFSWLCTKGKTTVKFVGTVAKCPVGYKIKLK